MAERRFRVGIAEVNLVNRVGLNAAAAHLGVSPATLSRALERARFRVRRVWVPEDETRAALAELLELVSIGVIVPEQRPDGQLGYKINPDALMKGTGDE